MTKLAQVVSALESTEPLSPQVKEWVRALDDPHLFAPLLQRLGHVTSLDEEVFVYSQLGRWPRGLDWSRVTASPAFRAGLARHAATIVEDRRHPQGAALLSGYQQILELGRREAPGACRSLLDALAAAAPFSGFPSEERTGANELANLALDGLLRELLPVDARRLESIVRDLGGMSAAVRAADAWYHLSGATAVPVIWEHAVRPMLEHEAGEDHYALISRMRDALVPYLVDHLVRSDGSVRNRTIRALGACGPTAVRPLIELYRANTDGVVRAAIEIALAKAGGALRELERIRTEESRRLSRADHTEQAGGRSLSPAEREAEGDDAAR